MLTRPPRYKTPLSVGSNHWQMQTDSEVSKKLVDTSMYKDDQSNNNLIIEINTSKDSSPELRRGAKMINFKYRGNSKGRLYGLKSRLKDSDASKVKRFYLGVSQDEKQSHQKVYKLINNKTNDHVKGYQFETADRTGISQHKKRGEQSNNNSMDQENKSSRISKSQNPSFDEKALVRTIERQTRPEIAKSNKTIDYGTQGAVSFGDSQVRGKIFDNDPLKSREYLYSKNRLRKITGTKSELPNKVPQTLESFITNKTDLPNDSDWRLTQYGPLPHIDNLLFSNREARKVRKRQLQSEVEFHKQSFMRTIYKGIGKIGGKTDDDLAFEIGCEINRLDFKKRLHTLQNFKKL